MTGPRTARVLDALAPLLSRGVRFAPGGVELKAGEFRVFANTIALGGATLHHPERPGLPIEPRTVYVERGDKPAGWFTMDTDRPGTDYRLDPKRFDGYQQVERVARTGSCADPGTLAEALETAGRAAAA